MNVLLVNGVFNDFLGAEGDVSGRVEVGGPFVNSSFASSPSIDFGDLSKKGNLRWSTFDFQGIVRFYRMMEQR